MVTPTISGVVLFHYLYTHTQNQPNSLTVLFHKDI